MKLHSHEEMLDTVIGQKGTAARNDFEARLRNSWANGWECRRHKSPRLRAAKASPFPLLSGHSKL